MAAHGRSNTKLWGRLWTIISVVALFVGSSMQDMVQSYCSNQNTGTANFVENYVYESNGYCSDKCKGQFAFAVVQDQSCWCSNYIPASQQSVSQCGEKCPGYPFENCGSLANGLFGYVALDKSPSGTAKGSTAQITAAPKSSNTSSYPKTTSEIVDTTVTQEDLDPASGPSKATPITSMQVVTISGSVLTQTVTTMPTTSADKLSQKQKLSNGAIIATAVAAVIAGVAILAAVIIGLFCWRRRQERSSFEHNTSNVFPQRNPSVLSKAGLLGGNASQHGVGSYDNVSPTSERRNSKPLVFDQRLNPNAFMHHDDGSRTSVLTMQDNQDYTRTLNVRNPDPITRAKD